MSKTYRIRGFLKRLSTSCDISFAANEIKSLWLTKQWELYQLVEVFLEHRMSNPDLCHKRLLTVPRRPSERGGNFPPSFERQSKFFRYRMRKRSGRSLLNERHQDWTYWHPLYLSSQKVSKWIKNYSSKTTGNLLESYISSCMPGCLRRYMGNIMMMAFAGK